MIAWVRTIVLCTLAALVGCEDSSTAELNFGVADLGSDSTPITPDSVPFQRGSSVSTVSGEVIGEAKADLRIFKGIPYATPPVGELRFRAPVHVTPWTESLDATKYGAACPQESALIAGAALSEDCLTLNIWAHDDTKTDYPVMVWIHGGAFTLGSSAQLIYDGADLAKDGKVVVVSINYRLGALGFLAIPQLQAEDPQNRVGNLGIQDQVEALRWVKTNIRAFGGDPDNITVFGESAGGISVCALIGAPEADGLFQRAISQSGTGCGFITKVDEETAHGPAAFTRGAEVVEKLGCADAEDPLTCLRALPVEEFPKLWSIIGVLTGSLVLDFAPTVDGAFLPKVPLERMRAGEAPEVDVIFGSNEEEATIFSMTEVILTRGALRRKFAEMVRDELLAEAMMKIYPISEFPLHKVAYVTAVGDWFFNCGPLAAAQAMGQRGRVYYFKRAPVAYDIVLGATHSIDMLYVFGNFTSMGLIPTVVDWRVEEIVQQAWSSFARTGTPEFPISWPAYDPDEPSIVSIDTAPALEEDYREGRCDKLRALGIVP